MNNDSRTLGISISGKYIFIYHNCIIIPEIGSLTNNFLKNEYRLKNLFYSHPEVYLNRHTIYGFITIDICSSIPLQ